MESGKQKLVAWLTVGGAVLFGAGLLGWFLMIGGGSAAMARQGDPGMLLMAGLPIGLSLLGAIMALCGLFIGFRTAFSDDTAAPVVETPGAYVMNCLILDKKGENVYDPGMFDPDELFYYVQVEFPDGTKREFRTVREVFSTIGEGMRGTTFVQGKWLGRFVPNRPGS